MSSISQQIRALKSFSLQQRNATCGAELFDRRLKGVIVSKFTRLPSRSEEMLPAQCILNSAKLVLDLFFMLFCQHQWVDGTRKINGIVSKRGPDGVELLLMSQNCCS